MDGFILTRDWRSTSEGLVFEIWAATDRGSLRIQITNQDALFFVERSAPLLEYGRREPLDLQTLDGQPVDGVYCDSRRAWTAAREAYAGTGARLHESDLNPVDRFLMERFIRGDVHVEGEFHSNPGGFTECTNPALTRGEYSPQLRIASIDIETEGLEGALYTIGVATDDEDRVFIVGTGEEDESIQECVDEGEAIDAFLLWIEEYDPDVIVGWNVIDFDLSFLERKCKLLHIPFRLGRDGGHLRLIPPRQKGRRGTLARMPGRVVFDGIQMLRTATWSFEQYGLEHIAQALLGRGKAIKSPQNRLKEIRRLYLEDTLALARYNLEDCKLVMEIFEKTDLIGFAVERARLTGLPIDRHGGSVAAFDFRYLPLLHREGRVAPDVGSISEPTASPGGYVMDSKPGLYENVLVLDFKSLYPSIIRTFNVDPLGMAVPGENPIPGFEGGAFSRECHVLPGLIAEMMEAREAAKRDHNAPLSQAIKIMMNSFYGVLGTPGCRFFHPRLVSSITRRGHELIKRTRDFIEEQGYGVIYGDTDSVFVLVGPEHAENACVDLGNKLANQLNEWWKTTLREKFDVESNLEIEFETHYLRFLMPTIRGSAKGTKKRYAGLVHRSTGKLEVVFTGLEAVRTDWTPLARAFQRELYRRIFLDEPYVDLVKDTTADVLSGSRDEELIYRKRLRREIGEYTKNVPPHVQAARKMKDPGQWVSYVITVNGPEPAEERQSAIDYTHYIERQLAPVADGILLFQDTSFEEITQKQLEMFSRAEWKG